MKEIDFCEAFADISEEYVKEAHATNVKKKAVWRRYGAAAACLCLCALLGLAAWGGNLFEKQPIQTALDATIPGIKDWYGPGEEEPIFNQNGNSDKTDSTPVDDDTDKHLFCINEITETVNGAPLYRDPDLHYDEIWDIDRTVAYLGVDVFGAVAALPEDLGLQYVGSNGFAVTFENGGTLVEDRICYNFYGNDGANLTVLVSKLGSPYDCIYTSATDKITNIRVPEKDATVSLRVYAQNKSNSALEYNFYVIDFEYAGNYYRIISENIASKHLDALIRETVK